VRNTAILLGAADRSVARGSAWDCARMVLLAEGARRSCEFPPRQPEEKSQKACNPWGFRVGWEKAKKQKIKPNKQKKTTL